MLKGKVALISGGSRGIGRAIALRFAEEGADVAILYASRAELAEEVCASIRKKGRRATSYACDVSDYAAVKAVVDMVKKEFGSIDVLVNNAGVIKDALLIAMKEQSYDLVLDTNLKGAFNLIRHCAPVMLRQQSGKIINISSIAGLIGNVGQANYAAAKAGLVGLTKSVARELASRHICCNAIAPGFIQTDMTAHIDESNPLMANIPLQRMGKPEEVAALAAFLAGPDSDYITGEVIRLDGGLAM